ncbi:MAG: tRNA (N6-threonylcarbamoyladenosine(37)-N6)-methyltransferase TrmO [Desulfobacter sp.]|nr:MAG: tRNA (N6-threonylcarbamoyladenosine(37)-N6)-methyltransferase TrmO [Desulfobacter sp.]
MAVHLEPIGILHTCFKEKFGIPRQPNLVKEAPGHLEFYPEFAREEALRALEGFSHLWLIFLFHKAQNNKERSWSPMVRPPRLGGNKKVGVFASRSPFRPNPIGLSGVALDQVEITDKGPVLHLSGVDILDQTPILDIKPYLPYSDSIAHAEDGFAKGPPKADLWVEFTAPALEEIKKKQIPHLKSIIQGILENDPRPAYSRQTSQDRIYGIRLFDLDIKWTVDRDRVFVVSIEPVE